MSIISPDSLSSFYVLLVVMGVEMINYVGALAPVMKTFIQSVFIIGPLCIACVILLLKKIEKDNPDRIRWK